MAEPEIWCSNRSGGSLAAALLILLLCGSPGTGCGQPFRIPEGSLTDRALAAALAGNELNGAGLAREALEKYKKALQLFQEAGERTGERETLVNLGVTYRRLGEYDEALANLKKALAMLPGDAEPEDRAGILNNLGIVHGNMGNLSAASASLHEALAIREKLGDPRTLSNTLNNLALVYLHFGEYRQALRHFLRAADLKKELGDLAGYGGISGNIGLVYADLGQPETARVYHQKAQRALALGGDFLGQATALGNLASLDVGEGHFPEALALYAEILELEKDVGRRKEQGRTLGQIGVIRQLMGDARKAIEAFDESLRISREIKDGYGEAMTLGNKGLALIDLARYPEARQSLEKSLELSETMGERRGILIASAGLGGLHEKQVRSEDALKAYRRSIDIYEELRSSTALEELNTTLSDRVSRTYERAVLLLGSLGRIEEAFELSEQARSRSLLDQMSRAHVQPWRGASPPLLERERTLRAQIESLERDLLKERARPGAARNSGIGKALEDRVAVARLDYEDLLVRLKLESADYAASTSARPKRLKDVQGALEEGETLVSYYTTSEKILAFLVTRKSVVLRHLEATPEMVRRDVLDFRDLAGADDLYPESLKNLYRKLFSPLHKEIRTPRIGIVPHGILHYVPFAALVHGQEYLTDSHEIFLLPSASLLVTLRAKKELPGGPPLVMARAAPEGLPMLRYAEDEARAVAGLYGEQALLGDAASETAFRASSGRHGIIHVAAHAELNWISPLFSRLVLASAGSDDGFLEIHEIYRLDLEPVDLVTLSACETNLGPRSNGDDVVALADAFFVAGARTVVSTLWRVRDRESSELMKAFYAHLRKGHGKAAALKDARSQVRATFPHPHSWAAFVLIGDPGQSSGSPAPPAPADPAPLRIDKIRQ